MFARVMVLGLSVFRLGFVEVLEAWSVLMRMSFGGRQGYGFRVLEFMVCQA